jgi:hypothetical protein
MPATLAQITGSATLRGLVKDQSGAVIPGAAVTLTNRGTKETRSTITNDEGAYLFGSVAPAQYTLKVELTGFKTYEQSNISLAPSDTRGLDVTLEVGAASETVTVTEQVVELQTETGAKENTITAKQIDNLSIISRSSLELLRILPGVVAPDQEALEKHGFNAGANANAGYHVNGLRGEYNNISIDGSRVIDIGSNNGTIITANPDMVEEVKVQTSNYAAEHGSAGVQISAVTKGGTSAFHGTIYDYVRHWRFSANDRSNNYANVNDRQRPKSKYSYPGFNIGGPVIIPGTNLNKNRDKLFFFFGLELQRQQTDPGTTLGVVPTLKQRQGDFSELLTIGGQNLNQPKTVTIPGGFANSGQPAPNNNLAPYVDAVGKALINLYPQPNYSDPNRRYNYALSTLVPLNRNQATLKVDYNISEKTKMYVRIAREYEDEDFARGLWWDASSYELPSHVLGTNLGRSVSVSMTSLLSPTTTNEILFSGSKLNLDNDYRNPEKVSLKNLGIDNYRGIFPLQSQYAPVAIHSWGGTPGGEFWEPGGLPLFAHNDSFSLTDNFSKVYKAHALKLGVLIEQANKKQNFHGCPEGCITLGAGWIPGTTGNDFGDLIVGRPAQFDQATRTPTGNFRFYNYEFYAQDSWKVRPNFTLEYGLRALDMPNNKERKALGLIFDPKSYDRNEGLFLGGDPKRPNGVLLASLGQIPRAITRSPHMYAAPRLNFAWDTNGKGNLIVRGGAGIFYNRLQGNPQYSILQQVPNTYSASIGAYDTDLTYANLRSIDPFKRIGSTSIETLNPDSIEQPVVYNMSFSLGTRLPLKQVLEVAYVGVQSRHMWTKRQIDFIPLGSLLQGTVGNADLSVPINRVALSSAALSQFRPYPAYGGVAYDEFTATSSYHSLQATLSRQTGKNFQYFATYTFSKALGTASSEYDTIDPIDARHRSYGVLGFDRTHVFNMSYNYNVPDGARGGFANPLTRGIFNGWQMSGISTFSSGAPIRLRFSGDISSGSIARGFFGTDAFDTGSGNVGAIAPVFSRRPTLDGTRAGEKMFDISAITFPAFGQSGPTIAPYYLRGPNRWNHDVTFFKNFKITESQKIQFRTGFFNMFNQAYARPYQGDFDLTLDTRCKVRKNGVPNGSGGTSDNVCDPTGGFFFTDQTIQNFGKIVTKHGRRVVEFALKYYF